MVRLFRPVMTVVALFLGLELLSDLDGDRAPALVLFEHARSFSGILRALSVPESRPEAAGS
jgi:hypothetical protein